MRFIRGVEALIRPHAWWVLAAYLLVPFLFKASLQPYVPVDLTLLLAVPASLIGIGWLVVNAQTLTRGQWMAIGLWFVLIALSVVGVAWAVDREIGLRSAAYFAALAGVPLLAAFAVGSDTRQVRAFLLTFVGAGLVIVAVGLWTLPTVEVRTLEVLGTNRLKIARAALFVSLMGLPLLAWSERGLARWGTVVLGAFGIFVALATGSRGPVLAFMLVAVALGIGALVWSRHRGRAIAIGGGLAAATVLVTIGLVQLLPPKAVARLDPLGGGVEVLEDEDEPTVAEPSATPPSQDPTATPSSPKPSTSARSPKPSTQPSPKPAPGAKTVAERAAIYKLAWEMFLARPLLGAGTGGFEAIAAQRPDTAKFSYPHNLALNMAADFGAVGLVVLASFIGLTLAMWRPLGVTDVALGGLLLFLAVNAMFSNGIYDNRMLWGIWLLLLAVTSAKPWQAR